MLRSIVTISFLVIVSSIFGQAIIRFEIKSLPEYHEAGSNIYIAGSFNGWNPQDENFKFRKDDKGNYFYDLKLKEDKYEYKITRGGWDKVECKKNGAGIDNRVLDLLFNASIELNIEGWADRFDTKPGVSTKSGNVCIIDTAFLIPQLNRTRRIWIYLPPSYCDGSNKKYNVLYMHDGQNLFDESTAFSEEWGIDEFLDTTLLKHCIVVGIDHGGAKRMNEYNPYDNEKFGNGEGDQYLEFLVNTLKPQIDKHYRTLKKKENTFIAGSSMGGLISMYALLKYPKVFGGAGVFSPSFGVGPEIFDEIKTKGKKSIANIYFYTGKQEGKSMVPDMLKVFEEMAAVSKSNMTSVIRDNGKHDESTWRKEFPIFYSWIMQNNQ